MDNDFINRKYIDIIKLGVGVCTYVISRFILSIWLKIRNT